MKLFSLTVFFFFSLPPLLFSQALYTGHIVDVATGEDLIDVQIELVHAQQQSTSNSFGGFVLTQTGNPAFTSNYQFFHNTLIWKDAHSLSLQLYGMDGRIVFSENQLAKKGMYLFPRLGYGIYVLHLVDGEEEEVFKVFSDGTQTQMVDTGSKRYQGESTSMPDTLRFTKAGYYTRDIPISGRDTLLKVHMLKQDTDDLHYFTELISPLAFDLISNLPSRSHASEVQAVKIMYDADQDEMYYMNSKRYELHYTFARVILNFRQGHAVFNQTQYIDNPNRYLYPANLNYYPGIDKYVLHVVAANEMSCENLYRLFNKIRETSYLGEKLVFFANKSDWDDCTEIPRISSEELYAGQNYQALNLTQNYGYLTQVELEDLEKSYLSRRDIVLLNGIPNDVSVVAGIITTEFQTPLSHINVLSNSRGTPNMALRDGWTNPQLTALLGQLVYLNVRPDSFEIRAASLEEAQVFWAAHEPQSPIFPDKNTDLSGLVDLTQADHSFVDRIGGKAANFAEF